MDKAFHVKMLGVEMESPPHWLCVARNRCKQLLASTVEEQIVTWARATSEEELMEEFCNSPWTEDGPPHLPVNQCFTQLEASGGFDVWRMFRDAGHGAGHHGACQGGRVPASVELTVSPKGPEP